jgi:hypothetical protein
VNELAGGRLFGAPDRLDGEVFEAFVPSAIHLSVSDSSSSGGGNRPI